MPDLSTISGTAGIAGLLLLLGGLASRLVFRHADVDAALGADADGVDARSLRLVLAGAALILLQTFAAAGAAAAGTAGPWARTAAATLALAFALLYAAGGRTRRPWPQWGAGIAGIALLALAAGTSRSADEAGLLPLAAAALHWFALASWGGLVLNLSLQRWDSMSAALAASAAGCRTLGAGVIRIEFAALAVAALSGMLLTFVHVHNMDALQHTAYGRVLLVKTGIAVLFILTLSYGLLRIAYRRHDESETTAGRRLLIRRMRCVVTVEAVLVAALIPASAMLATREAPAVAPFLNPQSFQLRTDGVPLEVDLQPVAGSRSRARFEITVRDPERAPADGTLAEIALRDAGSGALLQRAEALPVGPAAFLGDAVLPVPGALRLEVTLLPPAGEPLRGYRDLQLPAQPLAGDLTATLRPSVIGFGLSTALAFSVGALLLSSSAWLLRRSLRRRAPAVLLPLHFVGLAVGSYLVLSVLFVKTYPSTFRPNPLPYTAEVIARGEDVYREHCAECHGVAGGGKGPWAVENRGSIPDLTAPHMDTHTDGEIYWWITRGIPSLDMPPLAEEIPEEDRWAVINSVRSMRHGLPETPGAYPAADGSAP